jgi:hypothetical protein
LRQSRVRLSLPVRIVLITFASLLLVGCWTGRNFYTDSDAISAIKPGIYRASYGGETHTEYVSFLQNGLTQVADNEGKATYGFKPLDDQHRRFVGWYADTKDASNDGSQVYIVLERRSNNEFALYLPTCDGEDAAIAKLEGATIQKQTIVAECNFLTRVSLENAMRRVRFVGDVIRLVRIESK